MVWICAVSHRLTSETLGFQMVVLFRETLGGGAYLEEVGHWGAGVVLEDILPQTTSWPIVI